MIEKRILIDKDLIRDLKADILLEAMARGDSTIQSVCKNLLFHPSTNPKEIYMRQEVLRNALDSNDFFVTLYQLVTECINNAAEYSSIIPPRYDNVVPAMKKVFIQTEIITIYIHCLESMNHTIQKNRMRISSEYLKNFCEEFISTYPIEYLTETKDQVEQLVAFEGNSNLVLGGCIGDGMKLQDITLQDIIPNKNQKAVDIRSLNLKKDLNFSNKIISADAVITIDPNDLSLNNNKNDLVDSGFVSVLRILNKSMNEICSSLTEIREMLAFYTGILNLYKDMSQLTDKLCFPTFFIDTGKYEMKDLLDIGLVLKKQPSVVGNTISFTNIKLCIITGANQGGKTTFLRSIGLAQLMAQSGLFVTADQFACSIYPGIYTHFPNEEDQELRYGLLEKELQKFNELVSYIKSGDLLLMNESFSTTIEYDASYLANQMISAFCSSNITTIFVTHLYEYAHMLYNKKSDNIVFYRASRNNDGSRSYKILEGEPIKSSYALDLYHQLLSQEK